MLFHVLGIGLFLVSLFWRRWCPWSLGVPVWNSRCRREVEAQDVNDCWTGCPPPPQSHVPCSSSSSSGLGPSPSLGSDAFPVSTRHSPVSLYKQG